MYDDENQVEETTEEMKAARMHAVGEDTGEDPDMVEPEGDEGDEEEDEEDDEEDDEEEVE